MRELWSLLKTVISPGTFNQMLRSATPVALAAMGGALTEHAGIMNIGMDGMILLGAFVGVIGSYLTASAGLGVLAAVGLGVLVGLLFALFVVKLRSDEFIIGCALNTFAAGATAYLSRAIFGLSGTSGHHVTSLPRLHLNFLNHIPFLGKFAYKTRRVIPFLFVLLLLGAFFCSKRANYVYDQYSVESIRKNKIQLAKEKIKSTFGTPNTFAMIIPAGDNESEKEIVAEIKELRHTISVTGLSDIDAIDDYKLLDEVTPRQFAELLDLDIEIAELVYGSYALEHNEYGKAVTGMDSYRIALLDVFDYLLESKDNVTLDLDEETQDRIDEMKEELDDGKLQLLSDDWSRIVIDSDVPSEGTESYEYLSALRGIAARYYDVSFIVGDTTSCSDLKASFENDNTVITILEIVFVTLILIFTFHSVGLPLLLILVIQGSILINFSSPYLLHKDLFFLTYLIISAIQMGANIDYAIVISDRYLESRRRLEPKEAITDALNKAFPTIVTSGTMMAAAGGVIAFVASNETISAIGVYLGKGTLISMLLVRPAFPVPAGRSSATRASSISTAASAAMSTAT